LYVQTPKEDADHIGLAAQRHLINNFKLATEMGAELIRVQNNHVGNGILQVAEERKITTICIGKPHLSLFNIVLRTAIFNHLLKTLSASDIDLVILS
jgi:two-component system, OmpR family, sensor histidine kinase KdpD